MGYATGWFLFCSSASEICWNMLQLTPDTLFPHAGWDTRCAGNSLCHRLRSSHQAPRTRRGSDRLLFVQCTRIRSSDQYYGAYKSKSLAAAARWEHAQMKLSRRLVMRCEWAEKTSTRLTVAEPSNGTIAPVDHGINRVNLLLGCRDPGNLIQE